MRRPTSGRCSAHDGGRTLGHKLVHYLDERVDVRRPLARRDSRLARIA